MNIDKPLCNLKTCRYCHDGNCFLDYERCEYTLAKRQHDKWEYLKEHITEMRDADGELDQKQTCHFILNLMGVIEKEGEAREE